MVQFKPAMHHGAFSKKHFKFRVEAAMWSRWTAGGMHLVLQRCFSSSAVATGLVTSGQRVTQEHIDAFLPTTLRRLVRLQEDPPDTLERVYHKQLDRVCTNPAAILKKYVAYCRCKTRRSLALQVRYATALAHCFGFNSFWATEDKQRLHKIRSFKALMCDIFVNRARLKAEHVPRLLYALTALEYRSPHLLPALLNILSLSLHRYRPPTLATMGLCLGYMGIGDAEGPNCFGNASNLSPDYSGLLYRLCSIVARHISSPEYYQNRALLLGPFEASGLAFAMVMSSLYDAQLETEHEQKLFIVPILLKEACRQITLTNLPHSGWVQFFLYQTLYCTDVEKPEAEIPIKRSIPLEIQKALHLRWLDSILLNGQPQGSEEVQQSVHAVMNRLSIPDALVNCSAGRAWDEQHCWFAGHLIKSRELALHYDYALPLGPQRPKPTGWIQLQARMFRHFGYHTAFIHRCYWLRLKREQQDMQIMKLLSAFPQKTKPVAHQQKTPLYTSLTESVPQLEPEVPQRVARRLAERKRRTYQNKNSLYPDVRVVL